MRFHGEFLRKTQILQKRNFFWWILYIKHVKRIDFKNKRNKYIRILQDLKRPVKGLQKYNQKGVLAKSLLNVIKNLFYDKSCIFSKELTWYRSPWAEMGGNGRKLVKNGILKLYLVKFTLKLKFFLDWSTSKQVPR